MAYLIPGERNEMNLDDISIETSFPEFWYIKVSRNIRDLLIKWRGRLNERGYILNLYDGQVGYWVSNIDEFTNRYVEINTEQFIKHVFNKNVIGYKSPDDMFKGKVPKGTIYVPYLLNEFGYFIPDGSDINLSYSVPGEIVRTWDLVLEDEMVTLKFGDVNFIINKSAKRADTSYGTITMKEIGDILNYIDNPPNLLGYGFSLRDNSGELKKDESDVLVYDNTTCYIGCKKGNIGQLRAIYKAFLK